MHKKLLATFTLLIFTLAITGYAYTHWQETLQIHATIKTGQWKLTIDSYKLLIPTRRGFNETHPIYHHTTDNNQSLIAECQNVTGEWTIKIGLLIKNNGTIPTNLESIQITFNITDASQKFTVTTYYYGPFRYGYEFNPDYWGKIKFDNAPPTGGGQPPITLNPDHHAITWTIIQYIGDPNVQGMNIQITIKPISSP